MTEELKLTVISDGTPRGTKITDQHGNELRMVTNFVIRGESRSMLILELEIGMTPIEICAQPKEMVMRCTVCGYEDEPHNCLTQQKTF